MCHPVRYFNSRLSARGYLNGDYCFTFNVFQFTPLCERLQLCFCSSGLKLYFNSRLSARGYISVHLLEFVFYTFQFTPLCERLLSAYISSWSCLLFQFTPLCERLRSKPVLVSALRYFNSRLSARGYQDRALPGTLRP